MPRILVLCLGNVNRSPLCAAVLRAEGVKHVSSAGFLPGGKKASKKTRDWAEAHGYDLSAHRSTEVTEKMAATADVVVVMDKGNVKRFREVFPAHAAKVRWLGGDARIPDPAWLPKDSEAFEAALQLNVKCSKELARYFK